MSRQFRYEARPADLAGLAAMAADIYYHVRMSGAGPKAAFSQTQAIIAGIAKSAVYQGVPEHHRRNPPEPAPRG